jgi:hypothetical protein
MDESAQPEVLVDLGAQETKDEREVPLEQAPPHDT